MNLKKKYNHKRFQAEVLLASIMKKITEINRLSVNMRRISHTMANYQMSSKK